ncbi:Circadian clock protein kinase KaiC [uncultured archaeon]|nr:Circadian clock protein kinase KaiC [uncultured archaeon]
MNLLFPKVPSGIPGLDKMIGGGFTKNSVIAVSGSTGSGRTTFATQFLVNGWRQNQEPGIFLSFNEPKYSIFANMSAYDWNLPDLERNKSVVFIEYPSSELSSFVEQEGSILELIDTLGVERVVFDSVTPLAMLADGDERVRSLQKLINVVRKWGVSALITADDVMPPDPDLPRTSVGIEAMTDGYIHLRWMREGNRRLRTLEVVKMRGSAHAHLIHLTTIDSQGYHLVDAEMPENDKKGQEGVSAISAPPALSKADAARTGTNSNSAAAKSLGAPKVTGMKIGAMPTMPKPISQAPPSGTPGIIPKMADSTKAALRMPGAPLIRQAPDDAGRPAANIGARIRPEPGPKSTTPVPKPPARKAPPKEPQA